MSARDRFPFEDPGAPGVPAPGLLARHLLFESTDLDETREWVSRVFCPHRLEIVGQRERLDARMYHASIGGVSLNRIEYGASVAVDAGRLGGFYLVQMPIRGGEDVRCGAQTVQSRPGMAAVVSPTLPMRKRARANTAKIAVRIDRSLVERVCAQRLGHALDSPVEFDAAMPLDAGTGADWRSLVDFLCQQLSLGNSLFQHPMVRAQVEELIATTLLLGQPHRQRDELLAPARAVAPRYVKRAEEYVVAHADQPIGIADIAAHAGVSARALFSGFRKYRNTSPKSLLNQVRLQRVRAALLEGGETVTQAAVHWGFFHLGRFSAEYRRHFGELPSDTRKRAGGAAAS